MNMPEQDRYSACYRLSIDHLASFRAAQLKRYTFRFRISSAPSTKLQPTFHFIFNNQGDPVQTKPVLTHDDVKKMAAAAEAEAIKNQWAVTIAICDEGGHMLWLQRLDGANAMSAQIGPEKARTSALGKRATKGLEDMINNGRVAFLSVPFHGLLEGGEPIVVDGWCIGAIGVSGVKSSEDAQIARAGIAALS